MLESYRRHFADVTSLNSLLPESPRARAALSDIAYIIEHPPSSVRAGIGAAARPSRAARCA